jgi:ABC-type uncharacterized transport system ATPase subunit
MTDNNYILQMMNIYKTFGDLIANNDINLNVRKGTVHAIVGENGAGKSTLMNILTSYHKMDSGEIFLNGKKVNFRDTLDAARHGIGMVHQEFMLFRGLTVLENIMMGFEQKKAGIFIDKAKTREMVEDICERYHFNIPLDAKVEDLAVSMLQQVEIVKVLYRGAEIVILDEPTSVLTPQGIEGLFEAIRFIVSKGKTVIFITHKLKEVFTISEFITVLRNGRVMGNVSPSEVTEEQLASLMVGRDVILQASKLPVNIGAPLLEVKNLFVADKDGVMRVKGVNFEVNMGEIVGIAGVAGSGQQQLVEALYGLRAPKDNSEIYFQGENITETTTRERRCLGIGYVPQDRMTSGVNAQSSVWENAIMGYHIAHGFKNKVFLDHKEITKFTDRVVDQYDVRLQNINDKVKSLSGGNIQKLIVGREFIQENKLLIVEDPTRGIDVGAIEFIWKKIIELAASGVGILLVSHELNEAMQLSDRLLVIYDGKLVDAGRYNELNEKQIGLLMLGGHNEKNN